MKAFVYRLWIKQICVELRGGGSLKKRNLQQEKAP
jgi:hypothetical protein